SVHYDKPRTRKQARRPDLGGKLFGFPEVIAVQERQQLAASRANAGVAGLSDSLVGLANVDDPVAVWSDPFRGLIRRSVIDNNYLGGLMRLGKNAFEGRADVRCLIVRRDDNTDNREQLRVSSYLRLSLISRRW